MQWPFRQRGVPKYVWQVVAKCDPSRSRSSPVNSRLLMAKDGRADEKNKAQRASGLMQTRDRLSEKYYVALSAAPARKSCRAGVKAAHKARARKPTAMTPIMERTPSA